MVSSFRRFSQSKLGAILMVLFLVAILASFALMDIKQFQGGAGGGDYLAKAGDQTVTERDYSFLADRALAAARQDNPEATMASLAGQLPDIFNQLVDERVLEAFGNDHGMVLSKRLIDGRIASLPAARGLDGKFSDAAYADFLRRERLTDATLRRLVGADLRSQLMLAPIGAAAIMPTGMATRYASMLLEQRQGEMALVPTEAFMAGLDPSAGDLTSFYNANKGNYVVPEQRVLQFVSIGPEQVDKVEPSDAEIAAYYKANAAKYSGKEQRVISQATVPSQQAAAAIAQRVRAGSDFAAAAAPAGVAAADTALGLVSRDDYKGVAGDEAAKAVFAAQKGSVIGPIKTSFGWTLAKVEDIKNTSGKSIDEARAEIRDALVGAKRKDAIDNLVGKVEDAIADGASLTEAAKANGLTVVETQPITAQGVSRTNPEHKVDPQLASAVKTGFGLAADEDPVVDSSKDGSHYTVVGVGRIIPSAPAPFAEIRERLRADWIKKQAMDRARAVAQKVAGKVAQGASVAEAAKAEGQGKAQLTPITARRIDINQAGPDAAVPLRMLFSLAQGKSRMAADPQGRGFFVIKTDKITPGDAGTQPGLIVQTQQAFGQTFGQELAEQFLLAAGADVGVKRNDAAIRAATARLTGASTAE